MIRPTAGRLCARLLMAYFHTALSALSAPYSLWPLAPAPSSEGDVVASLRIVACYQPGDDSEVSYRIVEMKGK